MQLKSKYITADDYKDYFGIDLTKRLKTDDNPSNTVNAFIMRVENRIASYLDAHFYRNVDREYPHFTDYQKEHYKLALLEQIAYILRNGDLSTDSGYDTESGVVANKGEIESLIIAPNCKDNLILCGIWNRKIRNKGRGGLSDGWIY